MNLQSTDVADEEQLFFLPDEAIETEEEILAQKEQARQNARDEETTKIKLAIKNDINPNKQNLLYIWGNKRRHTYQGRTRHKSGIQSKQKKTLM